MPFENQTICKPDNFGPFEYWTSPVFKWLLYFDLTCPNVDYFTFSKDADQPAKTLKGDVLIYRNPCLHPGDLRLVQAVDRPELSRFKNVILFPAKNSCVSSLADECSGGDLVTSFDMHRR